MRRVAFVLMLVLTGACRESDAPATERLPVTVVLSPDSARHGGHTFSPDGSRIAYWERAADSSTMWLLNVANADLSAPVTLDVRSASESPVVWHPDGTRLAAVSSQYGLADIVLVTVTTGEVLRATRDPGFELPLAWSADGTTVSYLRTAPDGAIRMDWLSVADLTSRPVLPNESRPAIGMPSPDGTRIAYQVIDGSSVTIWVADSDGGNARQLTRDGLEEVAYSPWSPDSREILFLSRRTGTADLWIAHVDSAEPRQLTRNVRNELWPEWSPDGEWIAFLSDRGKQTDVWVIPAKGGEERRVTNSTAEETRGLVWRPGTNELTFSIAEERSGLWAVDLASGAERQLTPDSLRLADFWLSPDGTSASIIIEYGGGARDLAVVPIAGGAMRILESGQANIRSALHSPDGTQIAFISDRAGSADLWLVDVAGGAPRQLVDWPGTENSFAWSEDGTSIFFTSDRESQLGDIWSVPSAGGEPTRVTRNGGVFFISGRAGYPGIYVSGLNTRSGGIALSRLREDGSVQAVWDRSNAPGVYPLTRDSLLAMVEQSDGTLRAMMLSAEGGGGRLILNANETAGWPTPDASAMMYAFPVRGAFDLAMLTFSDGSVRRVTTTPEDELGAELTPDKQTVVFVRKQVVQRLHSADLSAMLRSPMP